MGVLKVPSLVGSKVPPVVGSKALILQLLDLKGKEIQDYRKRSLDSFQMLSTLVMAVTAENVSNMIPVVMDLQEMASGSDLEDIAATPAQAMETVVETAVEMAVDTANVVSSTLQALTSQAPATPATPVMTSAGQQNVITNLLEKREKNIVMAIGRVLIKSASRTS